MTFTKELYERTTQMYAGITNRSFSKLCGKSDSYYSSLVAQRLEISTSAILSLMDELEKRKQSLKQAGATNRRIERVNELQQFMADEIANRNHARSVNQMAAIRLMLLEAVSNLADKEIDSRTAMPMFIG